MDEMGVFSNMHIYAKGDNVCLRKKDSHKKMPGIMYLKEPV